MLIVILQYYIDLLFNNIRLQQKYYLKPKVVLLPSNYYGVVELLALYIISFILYIKKILVSKHGLNDSMIYMQSYELSKWSMAKLTWWAIIWNVILWSIALFVLLENDMHFYTIVDSMVLYYWQWYNLKLKCAVLTIELRPILG